MNIAETFEPLLPCPFCGEEAIYTDCGSNDYRVGCDNCDVSTEANPFDSASVFWNKRAWRESEESPMVEPDGHTPKDNTVDKDTNPKDAIGCKKLPLHLVPESGIALTSLAFLEGALKYGKYNWRAAGVRSSIYLDAMRRHYASYLNGEDKDPKTGVPHLASICACAMIMMDAKLCGKLNDDRPPSASVGDFIRSLENDVVRLQELFKDHRPHQYTIADAKEGDAHGR